jgi:hypothetical protein
MKKFKFILLMLCLSFCVGFTVVGVHAEENGEETSQEVTYQQQLDDFWYKWFPTITGGVSGTLGTFAMIIVFLKKINKKIEKKEKLTKEDYEEAKDLTFKAKEDFVNATTMIIEVTENQKESIETFKAEYNALVESNAKLFDIQAKEIQLLLGHVSTMKDLVCKAVASNPELASTGWATELIKLCDETDLRKLKEQALNEVGDNNE